MNSRPEHPLFDSPVISLTDVVATHAKSRGKQIALVCGGERRSWRELNEAIEWTAAGFAAAGLCTGDRVALIIPNTIPAVEAMLAVLRCGGVLVPLSAFLGPEALAGMIDDARVRLIVAAGPLEPLARQAAALAEKTPADGLIGLDFGGNGWRDLASLADQAAPAPLPRLTAESPMNIIYSSGTTGVPKGIVHSLQTRLVGALALGIEFRIDALAVSILATPLYTNGTWMTWLPTIAAGGTCVILERYTPEAFVEAVERDGGTHAFLVPTQIRGILDLGQRQPVDFSRIRMIVSAGSAIPRQWKEEARAAFGGKLMELYGLTEGIATTLRPEQMAEKPDSVGTPIGSDEIHILGEDDRIASPGTIGEIVGYGAGLMAGYHNRPDATEAAIWRDARNRTFLRTGDIGRFDDDGYLYILDRKKDMIVSGGVNVFASDIERVVHEHPDVADVAVIAEPHPKWVETPVALVILVAGASADGETLRAWANARLGKHQQLTRVELRVDDFPRNALGKVLKRALRQPR